MYETKFYDKEFVKQKIDFGLITNNQPEIEEVDKIIDLEMHISNISKKLSLDDYVQIKRKGQRYMDSRVATGIFMFIYKQMKSQFSPTTIFAAIITHFSLTGKEYWSELSSVAQKVVISHLENSSPEYKKLISKMGNNFSPYN